MENKAFRFKTNINCGACVASVTPHLNNVAGIRDWDVDINTKDKVLTVKGEEITRDQVLDLIKKAGFKAEPLAGE